MVTPSSITGFVLLFAAHVERLQFLDDAPAFDAALLQVMIEHFAHQPLRLGRGFGIDVMAVGERQQCRTSYRRTAAPCSFRRTARAAIEGVMGVDGTNDLASGIPL